MELPGSGSWWLSTFLVPCRLSTSIMRSLTCGKWPMRSLDRAACMPASGPNRRARCWFMARLRNCLLLLASSPKSPQPQRKSRSVPEKAVDYFSTNAQRMRYPAFRAQGMHVGSGEASAACKTVVDTRAKRTGMRWTPDGLDAVLPLRTAKLNHTYDEFWEHQSRLLA